MASFNIESQFLDLKKIYQNFEYEELITEGIVKDETAEQKDIYEGMTQNTYLFVQERTVLIRDIQNLSLYFSHKHCSPNTNVKPSAFKNFPYEKVKQRVCFIFQKYQQQPTLLDTLLEQLIKPIMDTVKVYLGILSLKEKQQDKKPTQELHSMLMIVYQLTKVRGNRWVTQYFPHEVKDLYPALGYLARQRKDVSGNWESRYVILLWMGVIALVPFNLDIIDAGVITLEREEDGAKLSEIIDVMIQIGKYYLRSLTKMREASALFLGKLFTRPDIQKRAILPDYINYVIRTLQSTESNPMNTFFICGLYESLYQIFKLVQRSQLLPMITPVLEQLKFQQNKKENATQKQLKIKLLTQIGLTYLKPRSASWAYYRKNQSLQKNLSSAKKATIQTNTDKFNQNSTQTTAKDTNKQNQNPLSKDLHSDVEYYRDVNKENLQLIIDMIVEGLTEKETTVRQEAAKGLGKIAGRLSQDMVLDILDYILNLPPSPQVQHAICLAIAEFIRRNLISPEKLAQLYALMRDSLIFEQQEGGYSVGQAVRDAACYMVWSVARAYAQGGYELGVSLMIAACFDREVGCRRAASAAYQELVGRVGDVPNGIEILTEADYFTLGLQKNAYLNVAIFVGSYTAYFKPFVEHLCYQKLRHWDLEIKRIAACSLSLMCPLNPHFISKEILPALLNYLDFDSMSVKLGTIIGIGEILLGLKGLSHRHQLFGQMKDSVFLKSLTQNEKKLMTAGEYMQKFKTEYEDKRFSNNLHLIDKETISGIIENIAKKIKQGTIYKGKAGENFRIYTCRLLQCFAICKIELTEEQTSIFMKFIEENIKNPLETILQASVKCLKSFLGQYHSIERDSKIIKGFLEQAKAPTTSKCFTLSLSKLTKQVYLHHFNEILEVLEHNMKITKEANDPQKRKYAILGLVALIDEIKFGQKFNQNIDKIFGLLFKTTEDYTTDKRGDIGSIVREASMSAMIKILHFYVEDLNPEKCKISNQIVANIISLMLQQLSEKIDRVRLLAGSLLQAYFDKISSHFEIPHRERLQGIFKQENIQKLIKQSQIKMDENLETEVIKMQMKIQETIFHEESKELIYFWNLPHLVFPLTVPLLECPQYSYSLLKGLCTSTGGISESIIKHSLAELGNYLTQIANNKPELLVQFFNDVIKLLKNYFRDDRIVIPLYKTLDFILEKEEVNSWEGLRKYDTELFYLIEKQIGKMKNIVKTSASTGLYVSLLSLNNEETKKGVLLRIIKILCSDLPKARKVLSDKLLMYVMSLVDYTVFTQEQSEELMNILSENDFLDQKLDVETIKVQIQSLLGIQEDKKEEPQAQEAK